MAGMIISNSMMFLPEMTRWVCLIGMAVFVFGIYIPYDKYKKNKKHTKKMPRKPPEKKTMNKPADWKRVQQLNVLKEAGLLTEEEYRERLRKL